MTRPFFAAIGVAPVRGRTFTGEESVAGAPPVAIVSDRLWRELFGERETVLASRLLVDGSPVPIIGVMPEGFGFPAGTDVWTAVERESGFESRTSHNFTVIGRLMPGATVASAQADLEAVTAGLAAVHADIAAERLGVFAAPLRDDLLGPQSRMVLIGLGAVLCVLMVACVNVANLMLPRSVSRETERSIRLALGAGPGVLVRQVLAEGLLLSAAGAVAGVLLAFWSVDLVSALTPVSITGGEPLSIDVRVLVLTLGATLMSGLACAVLPALHSGRTDARQALAAGNRTVAAAPGRTMPVLVGAEVAFAVVLLFGAGLLARSYAGLDAVDPGFRTRDLPLAQFSLGLLPGSPYSQPDARRRYWERLESAVAEVPGVDAVAVAALLPGGFSPNGELFIEGQSEIEQAHYRLVGGEYFEVLDIPVLSGRALTPMDAVDTPQVAVVNETLARSIFAGREPIGQLISMNGIDGGTGTATVVGVVSDVRHRGPASPPVPEAYFSYRQRPGAPTP